MRSPSLDIFFVALRQRLYPATITARKEKSKLHLYHDTYISVVDTISKERVEETIGNVEVVCPKIWTAVSTPLHSCRPFNKSDLPGE